MNLSKILILFMFLLFASSEMRAQSYISDFKKIKECYYRNDKQVSYELKIHYYNLYNLEHAMDSLNGKYYLYGSLMNIFLGGVRTIMNEEIYLTIHPEEKFILVGKNNKNKMASAGFEMFDTLIKDSDLVMKTIQTNKTGLKGYRLVYDDFSVDSLDIIFSEKTFFLNSVIVYYQSSESFGQDAEYKPVVKMEFINQKISDKPDLSLYDIGRYISIAENNKLIPTPKYKNYEIFNNLKF